MAITTAGIFLMKKTAGSSTWEKVVDINDFPDLEGAPSMLETTTLSDTAQTYIEGVRQVENLDFNVNYSLADYKALKALEGVVNQYAVWLGGNEFNGTITPTGRNGRFDITGSLSVRLKGGGTNSIVGMVATIAPTKAVVLNEDKEEQGG